MQIDYNQWHDGVGYDIDIIHSANAAERAEIEALLARRGAKDWRDVEALAALGATEQLRKALASTDYSVALAVLGPSPEETNTTITLGTGGPGGAGGNGGPGNIASSGAPGLTAERQTW